MMNSVKKIYVLYYWLEFDNGVEIIKILGAFTTYDKAMQALLTFDSNHISKPEDEHPQGFCIYDRRVDKVSWSTGFCKAFD